MWMFWPSFNSILVDERAPARELAAACSTYLALAAGAVAAAAVASLLSPKGKLSLVRRRSRVSAAAPAHLIRGRPGFFSSEAGAIVRPGRGRGRRRVPVVHPSAVGSHDDRTLCRRPLGSCISTSQGLDLSSVRRPAFAS